MKHIYFTIVEKNIEMIYISKQKYIKTINDKNQQFRTYPGRKGRF